ncbi:MAG TPA: DUF4367 domain-containing protein, partial [Candidatus Saccharimonadales bacterium]|nr:DUF4367 domain-containing protein [Candidatus Saccharimonadales bacterium]
LIPPPKPPAATDSSAVKNAPARQSAAPNVGPRPASVVAAIVAVVIIGGVIWQKNYPNIAIQSAAQKAGIQASLPSYVPSSYRLNQQISYGPGQLSLQFSSPNDPGTLSITQRRTNWNSTALLEYYVTPKAQHYISVQSQGLTIYLYNNHNASWVNRGIQYIIEGDTRLNRDQIVKIAESL